MASFREGSHVRIFFMIAWVSALVITFPGASGSGLAQSMPTAPQDEGRINATTECVGIGKDSESAANMQLNTKNNNTITQGCEQTISSSNGNGRNYATNTFDSNSDSTGNQVNQQSDQRIGD
jgi:hypothetical protein